MKHPTSRCHIMTQKYRIRPTDCSEFLEEPSYNECQYGLESKRCLDCDDEYFREAGTDEPTMGR